MYLAGFLAGYDSTQRTCPADGGCSHTVLDTAPAPKAGSAVPKPPLIRFKPGELRHKGIKRSAQRSHSKAHVKFGH